MSRNRSVVDFDSEDALRKALMAVQQSGDSSDLPPGDSATTAPGGGRDETPGNGSRSGHRGGGTREALDSQDMDWVLPSFDPETTEAQSMREELHRLQVLKNYLILDADREEVFERLTGLASRFFGVPIALISLVDLGRQWFLSNRGLGEVRETPRRHAFCAHAILNKHNILIVPDATKDFRFKDNPLVTGPPNIRFYAGAVRWQLPSHSCFEQRRLVSLTSTFAFTWQPLLSPEGYKLGTFCIIDDKVRPNGLSQDEQASLRDLADMAVREMVDRRVKMKDQQNPAQLIAYTAHDLMTPLTGVQISLSLLKDDEFVSKSFGEHQHELLTTAVNCSDLMIRICQNAIDTLRQQEATTVAPTSHHETGSAPMTIMSELVKSLALIMDPITKTVPLVISLESDVPPVIVCDDLKLFRSALNLLSNAVERTILGVIWLRIFRKEGKDGNTHLWFECTDTGPDVAVEQYQYLYKPSQSLDGDVRVGLSSVASIVNSLDGEYGFSPLGMLTDGRREAQRKHGSIFWFSIPLHEPKNAGIEKNVDAAVSVLPRRKRKPWRTPGVAKAPIIPDFPRTNSGNFLSRIGSTSLLRGTNPGSFCARTGSGSSVSSQGLGRFHIKSDDQFHAGSLQNTPFPEVATPAVAAAGRPSISEADEDGKPPANPSVVAELQGPTRSGKVEDSKPPGRKRRALVIEDSTTVRKLLARALDRLGYEVTQAPDGLQGLKRLKEKLFDLTLCDFLMPVMDGMDCVKQYRDWEKEHRPWFSAWIVGISAHANVNDKGQGITAGMNDFKPKPVSIKDLAAIQASEPVVDRSRQLDMLEASISGHDRRTSFAAMQVHLLPEVNQAANGEQLVASPAKKMRFSSDADHYHKRNPVCLMATDKPSRRTSEVLLKLEGDGWKVGVVNDGNEALRLLKMRNWDAVLLDDDLPVLSGAACMDNFREWEEENRVNRQRRTFLLCGETVPSPTDKSAIVQAPTGFDYVLNRPLIWPDLDYLLKLAEGRMEILTRQ